MPPTKTHVWVIFTTEAAAAACVSTCHGKEDWPERRAGGKKLTAALVPIDTARSVLASQSDDGIPARSTDLPTEPDQTRTDPKAKAKAKAEAKAEAKAATDEAGAEQEGTLTRTAEMVVPRGVASEAGPVRTGPLPRVGAGVHATKAEPVLFWRPVPDAVSGRKEAGEKRGGKESESEEKLDQDGRIRIAVQDVVHLPPDLQEHLTEMARTMNQEAAMVKAT